jgi:RNA polymerase sigma-B factor
MHVGRPSRLDPAATAAAPRPPAPSLSAAWEPTTRLHSTGEPERSDGPRSPDTRRLLERFRREGDRAARDELVARFTPLAEQLARRYSSSEPVEDLRQVAMVGLLKALDRFDIDRGVAFSSYAVPTMLGEIKRYFRDSGWAVHVPRAAQERALALGRVSRELSAHLGRAPSVAELAAEMELTQEEVLDALHAGNAFDTVSLDARRAGAEPGSERETYAESIGEEDDRLELAEYTASIEAALASLDPRDRVVLHLRFAEDLTQSEIAERIGVSQMQISRILRRAIAQLRDAAGEEAED